MNRFSLLFLIASFAALLPHAAAAATTRHEDNLVYVAYEGSWQEFINSGLTGGHGTASATAGARVSMQFYGTGVVWIGYRCPCGGIARVYIDGVLQETVDTYAAATQAQTEVYRITGLAVGTHTISVEVTGERNSAATNGFVGIDAFDVIDAFDLSATGTIEIQESDTAIAYTGDWTEVDHPDVSGGTVLASRTAGSEAVVSFNGTGIAWMSVACSCATGYAQAYLDGAPVRRVATAWIGSLQAQYEIYRAEGLVAGDHTLRIAVEGQSAGATPWVVIDSFMITDANSGADGDNVPPTAEVFSPKTGTSVRGMAGIVARAFDNVAVDSVRFLVDGVVVGEAPLSENMASIDWNTTEHSDGPHTLTVEATDNSGNIGTSPPESISIDNQQPTITITAPQNNATITGDATFAVEAADNIRVTYVWFFANDVLLAQDATPPYELTSNVNHIPNGRVFTLRAVAFDAAGNFANSSEVTVTVQH